MITRGLQVKAVIAIKLQNGVYEVIGDGGAVDEPDREVLSPDSPTSRHFLFYFRDETIEVVARDWSFTRKMPGVG
ncbi:hypothetical protein [Mesorhizobium sp.]|uniref:hypothetical protein n=1 Tax=Mesorhizobium sp. TaxID=1871066 RepID=UPI000FE81C82|nr:hypothetical protein [Mesorhizobium sp.]RWO51353.1 MAG: hypothetical protein EOS13_19745 [Mesorhizobium sp.]TIN26607.1 MAG: hypothetical protein E5Y19_13260 [Mesorhizobium sp.]TIN36537.1 MAG: hypothetical protein E5Y13_23755 [Mesorhizobium sp.]TJU83143.1 MAG: hypothetical protein E5Y15_14120 [Mesorhizobium sp.]TJU87733.1 MAG: hypothetical protein E5Y10_18665 [Mesorhizobium sp.]